MRHEGVKRAMVGFTGDGGEEEHKHLDDGNGHAWERLISAHDNNR